MTPPVTPAPQMGRSASAVRRQRTGTSPISILNSVALTTSSLANSMPVVRKLEAENRLASESPEPAMKVAAADSKRTVGPMPLRQDCPGIGGGAASHPAESRL